MSRIDDLIKQHCPDGVEYRELRKIGILYSGLTGKSKSDFSNGNGVYIPYKNIFSNIAVDTTKLEFVKIGYNERQNKVKTGDVLFTGSSENAEECGMSSVLTHDINKPIYLNSFCFGFRVTNRQIFLSEFLKYLFRDSSIRRKITRTANGVTRFNISKNSFSKITIPIPPLPVQEAIVVILDRFTNLEKELEAELKARRQQYEYYRDKLLNFDETIENVEREHCFFRWRALEGIAMYSDTRIDAISLNNDTYIGVDNLLQNRAGKTVSNYLPKTGRLTGYKKNDILLGNIRPYLKKIWYSDQQGGTNGDVLVIRIKPEEKKNINPRYLYQILADDNFFHYVMKTSKGAKMPRGNKQMIMNYKIPIPPLSEQARIVAILDRFDALVNDISSGLPAEIKARRQQYEHYRNRLLDFKELTTDEHR